MARKPITDMSAWPSLTLEGNLLAAAMVAKIERKQASEQTEADYRIRKGLTIREEISTAFRVGQSHFDAFAKLHDPSLEATQRFVRGFLVETFGFDDLAAADGMIAFLAGGRVPVVVVPPSDERLDRRSPALSIERSRSPALALQDYLNDSDDALWGLVTNGNVIRLMRDNASLTRPAYIEADLAQIFTNEDAASFAVLWSLIHRTRFGAAGTPVTDCALERWRDEGAREGEAARDRLAAQVEVALKLLGSGFLEANPDLAARLRSGEIDLTEWFNELLRLVYRLIFLMVAEDRNLLHPESAEPEARKLYAEGYSFTALRAHCIRAASWDKHHDRFEAVKIVFLALTHGKAALGLPALGGLFDDERLPHLKTARLRNRAFMQALYRLSWLPGKTGVAPVNWRAMKTEELGSVYESLLELQPQLGEDGKTLVFASESAEQKGNQRKTTGSYYTPDSLVQALLDTALDPVLDRIEAQEADPAAALLKLTVIDPACGSGHFLLSAAGRIATRLARIRAEGSPALADFRHALRDVARACIYGVDRNPMAVELTKVALWIETVDPGLPLGFFDAQIRCGDALLGVFDLEALDEGIPDVAFKPLTGDDKEVAKYYAQKNRREKAERSTVAQGLAFSQRRDLMREYAELRAMPETTLEEIEAKAAQLRKLTGEGAGGWTLARACDLYVAAFLLPKRRGDIFAGQDGLPRRGAEIVPTSGTVWEYLRGLQPYGPLFAAGVAAAGEARMLHWPLAFPDVMARGGFDVVLGNPPWERIKLQEQEFFAARSPEIAHAPNKAAREKLIKSLEKAPEGSPERALHQAFVAAKREAEAASEFARTPGDTGGRFALTGRGDVNTYALFAELFANLSRERAGVIVPTGIATDATTAPFFAALVAQRRLAQLVDFENREAIFPSVHRSYKFSLLTLSRNEGTARFAFFLTHPSQLAQAERNFTLSPDEIARLNPNTKTAPVFRSRADAELTAKIYARAPVLIEDAKGAAGNPWGVSFMAMFHMSNDSHLFRTAAQLEAEGFAREGVDWVAGEVRPRQGALAIEGRAASLLPLEGGGGNAARYVPLYEAKMIHQFDHRWATYDGTDSRDVTADEKRDPDFEPTPRYWVPGGEVEGRLSPLPKEFIAALKNRNFDLVAIFVSRLLFASWLANAGYATKPKASWKLFDEWCALVAVHPGLGPIAPTRLGLTSADSPLIRPTGPNSLPAAPIKSIVDSERSKTAWYDVDPRALEIMLSAPAQRKWSIEPEGSLIDASDVMNFGERLCEASLPRWLMGWRDIARATDERTTILSSIARVGVGHTMPLMLSAQPPAKQAGLLANLNSLALDYAARQALGGTHLTYFYLKQFSILPPDFYTNPRLAFITPRVLELTYTSHSLAAFARDLGHDGPPFAWDEDRRALLRAELDAFYARAYGLTRDELRYILDPADVKGPDYPSETFRVLKDKEIRNFGEYRTRRLVLEAWDRMEADGTFAALGL